MIFWILVMAVVTLVVLSLVRERFEATASIQAPPYDDPAKVRIYEIASSADQTTLKNKAIQLGLVSASSTDPNLLQVAAGGIVAPTVGEFFTTVFKPATQPITDSDVATFMAPRVSEMKDLETRILKSYFVGQQGIGTSMQGGENSYSAALNAVGQSVGYLGGGSSGGGSSDSPPPICPVGTILRDEDKKCVSQSATGTLSCPSGYQLEGRVCRRAGGTETTDPTCSAGFSYNAVAGICDSLPVDPTCPGDYLYREGKCMRKTPPATSTGGTSTSTYGPTTGGPTSRLKQVFGPQFAGTGGDLTRTTPPGDSSQSTVYPELLGGMIDSSSRIPGAGITMPSKNWTLTKDGSLPNSTSLGADEMSRYFPFSRSPGDMDVIPDPYRVAQTFSASSYSSKTEPVPFLTDFSAFQK